MLKQTLEGLGLQHPPGQVRRAHHAQPYAEAPIVSGLTFKDGEDA